MMSTFNTIFFCVEEYALAELGCTSQYLGEDLDLYVKTFREKARVCEYQKITMIQLMKKF